MPIKTMNLTKLPVWIMVMIQIFLFGAGISDEDKSCSCYTFEFYDQDSPKNWVQAKGACKSKNKHLVVMETEQEWEFINKEIQTRQSGKDDEWFIGLYRNVSTGKWTWVNGKALTISKWRKGKPLNDDFYTLMAKEFPPGFKGSFNSIKDNVARAWICEEKTDTCGGVCFSHIPIARNSTPPVTTTPTTQEQRTVSTTYNSTTATVSTLTSSAPEGDRHKGDNANSSTLVIVAASLGAVLFVVLITLAVVLLLRRRKRRGHGKEDEHPPKKSRSHQTVEIDQNQYEPVDRVEVAKLLGTPDINKAEKKIEHVSPSENCEYAVVNKKDKKRKEGDLVYAQLAEFDSANNEKTAKKPPSYEPTVYADVDVDVFNPLSVDSTQPTYTNVQTTGV